MRNVLFVISGPSGVGKGTLVKLLLAEDPALALSVSCTTRAPREGEQDGREYFFLSRDTFLNRIREGDFLEYDEHFGNYYGTPKSFVLRQLKEKSVILEIDVIGALKAREIMAKEGVPVVLIMIVPPDLETLRQRLGGRGTEENAELKNRLERVEYELSKQNCYDYVVVNDDLQTTERRLAEIIRKEKEAAYDQ